MTLLFVCLGPRRAFHAEGSQTFIQQNEIIKFGTVIENHHGGFNPKTSIFTCGNKGLYVFYVTISAYTDPGYGAVWYQIVQDSKVKAAGVTGLASGAVGTHFAMIQCFVGSRVWVKQGHAKPFWKQGMWYGHSQFGGFQIAFDYQM